MHLTIGPRSYDVTTRALVIAARGAPPEGADLSDDDGPFPEAPWFVDVTGAGCPTAATAVAVIRGARLVRTADPRGARRVCDVLAAVLEAR